MLICRSAAKINLTLDVLAHRDDGYHELQSVVHTIGLWDTLIFEFDAGQGFSLRCNEPRLCGEDNLCLKAARAWLEAARQSGPVRLPNLRVTLQKVIPDGAGLGGGSGNAAATLLALNRHFDNRLDAVSLAMLAARLGADVPLFLHGGCMLMEGIGDRLTPLPPLRGWVVVVQPHQTLSTPLIFRQWDESGAASAHSTAALRPALAAGDLPRAAGALGNDLSRVAQAQGVDVPAIAAALRAQGALGAAMTGSGSCVYGLFAHEEAAQAAARQLQDEPALRHALAAPLCTESVQFLEADTK